MCGISGIILDKEAVRDVVNHKAKHDVGSLLIRMSASQQIRGQDSFGLALFNPPADGQYKVMTAFNKGSEVNIKKAFNGLFTSQNSSSLEPLYGKTTGDSEYLMHEYKVTQETRKAFVKKLLALDREQCWEVSHGNYLTILKDIGLVDALSRKWFEFSDEDNIGSKKPWNYTRYATHGLAHVRIATATNVSQRNAHPFCCANVGDIAVVHNGEVTNAARIKKELIFKNYDFFSDNDTEVVASFIGNRMSREQGLTLAEACKEFIQTASGFYTCLIATPSEVAFIKDIGATRPALYGYHPKDENMPGFYAIATDISALAAVNATEQIGTVNPGEVKIFPTGLHYKPEKIQREL